MMLVYRPNPVLLPANLKQHPQIEPILLEYLQEVVYGNNSIAPIRLAWDLNDDIEVRTKIHNSADDDPEVRAKTFSSADDDPEIRAKMFSAADDDPEVRTKIQNLPPYNQFNHPPSSLYRFMSQEDKLTLLREKIPLSYDTFIYGDNLVTIGPSLPELDKLLGKPRLLLRRVTEGRGDAGSAGPDGDDASSAAAGNQTNGEDETEIKYFSESINYRLCSGRNMIYSNALKYSIATGLPKDVINNPNDWQLEFRYKFVLEAEPDKQSKPAEQNQRGGYDTEADNNKLDEQGEEQEFSHTIRLQANPFACLPDDSNSPPHQVAKSTLVTLQKDNPPELIKKWCEHYHSKHQVQRIIIYNNGPLDNEYAKELAAQLDDWHKSLTKEGGGADKGANGNGAGNNGDSGAGSNDAGADNNNDNNNSAGNNDEEKLELYLMEWDYSYQSYFTQCQTGALNHCYWLVGDAASYFLNFDLDEYLINDTSRSLDNCLAPAISTAKGIIIPGYEATNPTSIINVDMQGHSKHRHDDTIDTIEDSETHNKEDEGLRTNTMSVSGLVDKTLTRDDPTRDVTETMYPANPKYLVAPKHWHLLTPHTILKKDFFPAPPSWHLLNSNKLRFTLAKYFYRLSVRLFYTWQGTKRRLGLKELPSVMNELQATNQNKLHFIHLRNATPSWKWQK